MRCEICNKHIYVPPNWKERSKSQVFTCSNKCRKKYLSQLKKKPMVSLNAQVEQETWHYYDDMARQMGVTKGFLFRQILEGFKAGVIDKQCFVLPEKLGVTGIERRSFHG